jgi:predicted permease
LIRFGIRKLSRRIGSTAAIALTLGLGLGAAGAIVSVIRAVLLAPLPYPDASALVLLEARLGNIGDQLVPIPRAEFLDYRAQLTTFEAIGGFEGTEITLTGTGSGEAVRLPATRITASLLPMLRLEPQLGRMFTSVDERPNAPPVAIVSHALWVTQFGANPSALGQTVTISGVAHRVIGVMPAGVEFPLAGTPWGEPAGVWMPLVLPEVVADRGANFTVGMVARLRHGMTLAQATADVEVVGARMRELHSAFYQRIQIRPVLTPLATRIAGTSTRLVWLLAGAATVLMLIACANASNLLLAQAVRERGEFAIRLALGAKHADLVRQTITENTVLCGLGTVFGLGIAGVLLRLAKSFRLTEVPRLANAMIDLDVFIAMTIIALVVAVISGVAPSVTARRATVSMLLQNAGRQLPGRQRARTFLVILQTAGALILLLASGLLLNSFLRILQVRSGFDANDLFTMRLAFPETRFTDASARHTKGLEMLERMVSLPGVQAAAFSSNLPLDGVSIVALSVEGGATEAPHFVTQAAVSPGYFKTMAIPLRRGRDFGTLDSPTAPGVVVVSDSLARRLWPGENPLGKHAQWGSVRSGRPWLTVIGVVADIHATSLAQTADPMVYMPIAQAPPVLAPFAVLRSTRGGEELRVAVRQIASQLDAEIPIYAARSMRDVMRESLAQRSFLLLLIALFAAVAVTLSMLGLFGLLAFLVGLRSREIGVRLAVGASPARVLRQVVREGVILALIGAAIGIAVAAIATRPLSGLLYQVDQLDPMTYSAATALLLVMASAAAFVPARRAARTDPCVALRLD